GSFALSPVTNSFCHRRQRICFCLRPVGPTCLRQLDTSNGCQDHTTSPSAATSFVSVPSIAHGPKPALRSRHTPRVRDDRDTPLEWDETARLIVLIWVKREREYFYGQDWTASIRLIRFNK